MKKKLLFALLAMFAFTATYAQEEGEEAIEPVFTKSFKAVIDDAKYIVSSSHYSTGQADLQKAIDAAEGSIESLVTNAEVREEMIALQTAIDHFVTSNGYADATEKVQNPSFSIDGNNSTSITSWTVKNFKQNRRDAATYSTTRSGFSVHYFTEQWVATTSGSGFLAGSGDIKQTVTGLPAGHYRLTADIFVHNQKYNETCEEAVGVELYVNDIVREIGQTGFSDTEAAAFSIDFDVAEGEEPTIGFRFSNANYNWLGWDNITLYFIGDPDIYNSIVNVEKLAAAKEAIAASLKAANEALANLVPFYRTELQAAIDAANALTDEATLDEVNAAKEQLDAELNTFNDYNKHYTALKDAIEYYAQWIAMTGIEEPNGLEEFQQALVSAAHQANEISENYKDDPDGGAAKCDEVLAALQKAESTFSIKNASYANPANLISNGKMSSTEGWDILYEGANPDLHINTSGNVTNFSKPFMECWVNNTDYGKQNYARQTVNTMPDGSVLPSGFYVLKCAALATRQDQPDLKVSGVTLKFQDQELPVQTANGVANLYTIGYEKATEGGDLTIGLYIDETTNANWIAWDEVELQYVGDREKYYADYIKAVLGEKLDELKAAVDNVENALQDVDMEGIDFDETDLSFTLDDAKDVLDNPTEAFVNQELIDQLISDLSKNLSTFFASGVSPKAGKYFDYTSQIKNADFDVEATTGWTAAQGSELPAGTDCVYWWFGSSTSYAAVQEFFQTLYYMPAGNYMLEANAAVRVDMNYNTTNYTAENLPNYMTSCQVYANDNYTDVHPFFYEDEAKGLTLEKMLEMTNDYDYRHGNGTLTDYMLKESGYFKVYIPFKLESTGDIKIGFRLELPTLEDGTTKKNGQMPFIDYFHLYFFGKQEAQIPELAGINDIMNTPTTDSQKVYNLRGQLVRTANGLQGLPKGLYIVGGKKFIVR